MLRSHFRGIDDSIFPFTIISFIFDCCVMMACIISRKLIDVGRHPGNPLPLIVIIPFNYKMVPFVIDKLSISSDSKMQYHRSMEENTVFLPDVETDRKVMYLI